MTLGGELVVEGLVGVKAAVGPLGGLGGLGVFEGGGVTDCRQGAAVGLTLADDAELTSAVSWLHRAHDGEAVAPGDHYLLAITVSIREQHGDVCSGQNVYRRTSRRRWKMVRKPVAAHEGLFVAKAAR